MADNTPQNGTASITTDDVTTVNGGAITSAQAQRVKIDSVGTDGAFRDTSAAYPLPIYMPDGTTGPTTITVTDTAGGGAPGGAGVVISTAPTAGSFVAIACPGGDSAWNVLITGLTSGTLYFEGSLDSTNGSDGSWINVNGRQTGILNTVLAGVATSNGIWRGNTSGLKYFRIRSVGALTGTPAILIRLSDGTGAIFLNASIPAGGNLIGRVQPQMAAKVVRNFILDTFTAAPVADAMQSVVQWYNNAAVGATVSPAVVPAGKILRLTSWGIETKSLATVGSALLRLRANVSGTAVIGSPLVTSIAAGSVAGATTTAMTGAFNSTVQDFGEEGLEFAAGTGIGFSLAGYGPAGVLTLEGVTRFWAHGYEYTA